MSKQTRRVTFTSLMWPVPAKVWSGCFERYALWQAMLREVKILLIESGFKAIKIVSH